jgi:hypothetical protein
MPLSLATFPYRYERIHLINLHYFKFRLENLFNKPSPDEMINDKVYQDFVLPAYAKANQRAERLAARLRSLGVDPDQIH